MILRICQGLVILRELAFDGYEFLVFKGWHNVRKRGLILIKLDFILFIGRIEFCVIYFMNY